MHLNQYDYIYNMNNQNERNQKDESNQNTNPKRDSEKIKGPGLAKKDLSQKTIHENEPKETIGKASNI